MSRLFLATIAMLLALPDAYGDSSNVMLSRDTIIENVRYFSPNGRFCLVMRQFFNVPDLGGRRADGVVQFPATESAIPAGPEWVFTHPNRGHWASGPAFPIHTAALYDGKWQIATIDLGFPFRGGEVLVSDSGRYVALLTPTTWNNTRSPIVSIYRPGSSFRRNLYPEEVFSPNDLRQRFRHRLQLAIQENREPRRDVLLLGSREAPPVIRIDLATASRLGKWRDILPRRRF